MTRILLVEDESSLSEPLSFLLTREGFEVEVVEDGQLALDVFANGNFDIILLDLMIPKVPGNEVCRQIRQTSNIPIIMLTAKDTEVDKVVGLELGADDYVTKPYSTRELLARIKAVLRRNVREDELDDDGVIDIAGIKLDADRHTLHVQGTLVAIPLKEFELLEYLMSNVGRVLTRGQLIDRVWGTDYYGDTKTLDVHIKRLRSKIEADPAEPVHLVTVRGLGYRFDS
ncbi:two-component system response regulator RegX3 [Aurantimicrobium minutum]|uniref:response regulator transcription factor n=1 Tax=Aurantimicrobium minutum TaxID=708131 RepID=UPI002476FC91|nr:response regulator transcription factor [Aurantimicrobium minutum]MDH6531972.1 two-component system response regulator RegX3 [Aurantimicrobium minutum]